MCNSIPWWEKWNRLTCLWSLCSPGVSLPKNTEHATHKYKHRVKTHGNTKVMPFPQCSAVEWGFLAKFKYSVLTMSYNKLKRKIWVLQKKLWNPSLWRVPNHSDITGCLEKGSSWQKYWNLERSPPVSRGPFEAGNCGQAARAASSSGPELLYRSKWSSIPGTFHNVPVHTPGTFALLYLSLSALFHFLYSCILTNKWWVTRNHQNSFTASSCLYTFYMKSSIPLLYLVILCVGKVNS